MTITWKLSSGLIDTNNPVSLLITNGAEMSSGTVESSLRKASPYDCDKTPQVEESIGSYRIRHKYWSHDMIKIVLRTKNTRNIVRYFKGQCGMFTVIDVFPVMALPDF